jgi:hypothetical protein
MELRRVKNQATIIVFPIMKNDGTLISGAANLDSEIDSWDDGTAPDGFSDCTSEAAEIGTSGQYYLSLTAAEMNSDYIILQVKSSSEGAITQTLLINTALQGCATEARQDDILDSLVDIEGTGFVKDINSLVNLTPGTPVSITVEHVDISTSNE